MRSPRTHSSRRPSTVALLLTLVGALLATACDSGVPDASTDAPLQAEELPTGEEGQRADRVEEEPTSRGVERPAVEVAQQSAEQVEDDPTAPVDEHPDGSVETEPIQQDEDSPPVTPATFPGRVLVSVDLIRIIDGDTIEVRFANGAHDTVRYIGVDTPETVAPGQPVQAFGPEASARNAQLLAAGAVFLESDLTDRDRFDRLLRYVWVDDGSGTLLFVNLVLVAEGLATVRTYPPDVKYLAHYQAAGRGIWAAAASASENCAPSYPSVCIPPPPPDLNCGDIPFRRFRIIGSDPHRFDGDGDGIGCES